MTENIYTYITKQENSYQLPIQLDDNWTWNMKEHIRRTLMYKNSRFTKGGEDDRPFRNIMRPILNLQYRAEGFDVKDIILYINDKVNYFKSFLLKKYHEKWAREKGMDTFIDQLVETWVDYGGVLLKRRKNDRPEVVPWQRIAFVDQTDILNGPICEKHYYSPAELKQYPWENIEQVIRLSEERKEANGNQENQTPSKYIEVYELHGMFPRWWLYDYEDGEPGGYWYDEKAPENELVQQVHICVQYSDDSGQNGITLFKSEEKSPYKFFARDEIFGRALGLGGAEELFQAQIWTNYDVIRLKDFLDQAGKIIYQTLDQNIANRNNTRNLQGGDILYTTDPNGLRQVDTFPRSASLFDRSYQEWEEHARTMGAANEAILGEQPPSGTPFKSVELQAAESHGLHEYRKGKLATFLEEVYREWIFPDLARDIVKGDTFLAELELDELQQVSEALVRNEVNKKIVEQILGGNLIEPGVIEQFKQATREEFMSSNKKFIEIVKGEMKGLPMDIELNIAGKQKNLPAYTDKLVNIFRTIAANPTILQNPSMAKLFNEIIEASGLSPIDFGGFTLPTQQQAKEGQPAQTAPLQNVAQPTKALPV